LEEADLMEEILIDRIGEYAGHFPGTQSEMVLTSITGGNTQAQLWKSARPENGNVFLLWDKGNNVFYLAGNLTTQDVTDELASLIKIDIRKRAIEEKLLYFKVHALSPSFENAITTIFRGYTLGQTRKLFYAFNKPQVNIVPAPTLEGVEFALIDADFLERDHLQNIQQVKSEIQWMWSSSEKFRESGFGFAALKGGSIICWCTAEYVSRDKCGIGIETQPEFENKGIATSTTAHFVSYCLSHDINPYWECAGDNIGSIRVAEKVGFEKIDEAIFWAGVFDYQDE